jgi:hypothetical protein
MKSQMDITGHVYKLDIYQQKKRAHLIILSKETTLFLLKKALNYKAGVWYDHLGQLQPVTHSINIKSCTKDCASAFFLKKKKGRNNTSNQSEP